MPLSADERIAISGWRGFSQSARQDAQRLTSLGVAVPDVGPTASLESLSTWLASLNVLDGTARRTLHGLINSVAGMQRVLALAGRHGCPTAGASLQEWESAIAALAATLQDVEDTTATHDDEDLQGTRPVRILCVEDDENWQTETKSVLRSAVPWLPRSRVAVVGSAQAARGFVDKHRNEEVLVILDLGIPESPGDEPDRSHGLSLLAQIRSQASHWPVIVWSVPFDSVDDHRVAVSHGISDYLLKTSSSAALAEAIRRAVAQEPYRLAFTHSEESIAIDNRLCSVTAGQRHAMWEMALDRGWRTAAEWEARLDLPPNGFHGLLSELQARLVDEFSQHERYLEWPRLIATRPRHGADEGDGPGVTLEYKLVPNWDTAATSETLEARRAFRVFPRDAEPARTRVRALQVLIVDDQQVWHDRVGSLLGNASYISRSVNFRDSLPQVRPDVVCLDLLDDADPPSEQAAGLRWLHIHLDSLGGARIVILSSVSHRDDLRLHLVRQFGVRLSDVVVKDEDSAGEGRREWPFHLLRSLYQIERERIVGIGLTSLAQDRWPPSFQRSASGWELVTGQQRAPVFTGAINRRRLIERLATRPFLPVPLRALNEAVYGEPDGGRNKLALLVTQCRKEIQRLMRSGSIMPIDTENLIQYADDGYVLNARVVRAQG
jgi:DNA-binding NarL/FixJ family response regulator